MLPAIEVKVPDIGDFKDLPIIDILVKPGDTVGPEDPLVSLESDKATMDVPSPVAGVVKEIAVKVGDKVSEGSLILLLEAPEAATPAKASTASAAVSAAPAAPVPAARTAPGRHPYHHRRRHRWCCRYLPHRRAAPSRRRVHPERLPGREKRNS